RRPRRLGRRRGGELYGRPVSPPQSRKAPEIAERGGAPRRGGRGAGRLCARSLPPGRRRSEALLSRDGARGAGAGGRRGACARGRAMRYREGGGPAAAGSAARERGGGPAL